MNGHRMEYKKIPHMHTSKVHASPHNSMIRSAKVDFHILNPMHCQKSQYNESYILLSMHWIIENLTILP